jgi:hypothetical protein
MNTEFDWSKVKVRQVIGSPPLRRRRDKFIAVPLDWAEKLYGAKYAATFKIALCLLNKEWHAPGQPIRLSNFTIARLGLSRNQKARGVEELRRLGLVLVEEGKPRQSPLVKVKLEARGG